MSADPSTCAPGDSRVAHIRGLLDGHADRAAEAEILRLLREAGGAEIDHVVRATDLRRLISGVDDRLFGPDNRAALFQLLCEERLADLSIPARAALIAALQRGRTSSSDERAIVAIFLGTRGERLTDLKNAVDAASDDHRDLHQLVYSDIDDGGLRERLLAHFAAEAAPRRDFKILSDIDDTLYRNWKDARYPDARAPGADRPYLYPGVRAFYRELDVAFSGGEPADLAFLTARPGDRAGAGEAVTRGHLSALGFGYAKILTGDLLHLATHQLMADRKVSSFLRHRRIFPEYGFVFCGDSGQGDAIAGRAMMALADSGMLAVFIHDVVATSPAERDEQRAHGVRFHDTYAGAAVDAHAAGLLDVAAVERIAAEALADMEAVPFIDPRQREARFADLRRDLDRAAALVRGDAGR